MKRLCIAASLAALSTAATAETLTFDTVLDSASSAFDISLFVDGNPNLAGFLLGLQPDDGIVSGYVRGTIDRSAGAVTAVDTQDSALQLESPATDDIFIVDDTIGEFPEFGVRGTIEDPGLRQQAPTGPQAVNSPFPAPISFFNTGFADFEIIVNPGGFLEFSVPVFSGDLEDAGVGFGPIPLVGEITPLGGDDYVLSYVFDGEIPILDLPSIVGGGTAVWLVEASLVTERFTATPSSVIPLPATAWLLMGALAALSAAARRR